MSEALGVHIKTVRAGKKELTELPDTPSKRIRKAGGGAKKITGLIINRPAEDYAGLFGYVISKIPVLLPLLPSKTAMLRAT